MVYQKKFTVRCGNRSTTVSLIRRCHRRNLFVFLFEQNWIKDSPVNSQLPLQKQFISILYNANKHHHRMHTNLLKINITYSFLPKSKMRIYHLSNSYAHLSHTTRQFNAHLSSRKGGCKSSMPIGQRLQFLTALIGCGLPANHPITAFPSTHCTHTQAKSSVS